MEPGGQSGSDVSDVEQWLSGGGRESGSDVEWARTGDDGADSSGLEYPAAWMGEEEQELPWMPTTEPDGGVAAGRAAPDIQPAHRVAALEVLPHVQPLALPGDTPAPVAGRSAASASRPAPPIRRAKDEPRKRKRRNYDTSALSADQVEALMNEDLAPRPLALDIAAAPQAEVGGWIFKELGKVKRQIDPRADKWRRGGGAGGATDLPNSEQPRVRRRYGYVIPTAQGSSQMRYHQYCRLVPNTIGSHGDSFVEDPQLWLFHVLPAASALVPEASSNVPEPSGATSSGRRPGTTEVDGTLHVVERRPAAAFKTDKREPLLCLSAAGRAPGQTTDFVRFEESGRELGGVYHSDHGLQLRSAAGDFAEWHPALDLADLPYAEGSVVGLFGGKLSLRTVDADMVAVVSRRALCVGSFPGPDKAVEGDVIAYLGQVPVRVRGNVASGDTLVPSTRHDGTAIAWRDGTDASKHDDGAATVGIAMSGYVPGDQASDGHDADIGLVDALVTPPSSRQRRQQQKLPETAVDPALDFVAYQHRSASRRRNVVMRTCVAFVACAVGLALTLMYAGPVRPSRCDGIGCNGGSVHPQPRTADQDPCDGMSCAPGNCTIVGNGRWRAGSFTLHQSGSLSLRHCTLGLATTVHVVGGSQFNADDVLLPGVVVVEAGGTAFLTSCIISGTVTTTGAGAHANLQACTVSDSAMFEVYGGGRLDLIDLSLASNPLGRMLTHIDDDGSTVQLTRVVRSDVGGAELTGTITSNHGTAVVTPSNLLDEPVAPPTPLPPATVHSGTIWQSGQILVNPAGNTFTLHLLPMVVFVGERDQRRAQYVSQCEAAGLRTVGNMYNGELRCAADHCMPLPDVGYVGDWMNTLLSTQAYVQNPGRATWPEATVEAINAQTGWDDFVTHSSTDRHSLCEYSSKEGAAPLRCDRDNGGPPASTWATAKHPVCAKEGGIPPPAPGPAGAAQYFTVDSGPCTVFNLGRCVGRPHGYLPSEYCVIRVVGGGTLGPCLSFDTDQYSGGMDRLEWLHNSSGHRVGDLFGETGCPVGLELADGDAISWTSDEMFQGCVDTFEGLPPGMVPDIPRGGGSLPACCLDDPMRTGPGAIGGGWQICLA